MAVTQIEDILLHETGRMLPGEILHRGIMTSPMLGLVQQGSWSDGMGYQVAVTQVERTLPAPSDTYSDGGSVFNPAWAASGGWQDIGTAGFGTTAQNNCSPPEINLQQGTSKTLFGLQHIQINSPRFCVRDLAAAFDGERQFGMIKKNLADITNWMLAEKFTYDYVTLCANKYVFTRNGIVSTNNGSGTVGTFNDAGALQAAGAALPTALTMPFLIDLQDQVNRDGAFEDSLATDDGAPVHGLITSQQQARNLMVATPQLDNFRWNRDRVPELLKPLNVTQPPINGLQLLKTSVAARWNYTNGAWVKVEPFYFKTANVGGYKLERNPAYETALWEDVILFHPRLMEIMFPGSVANTNGTTFNNVNYRGMWEFLNYRTDTNKQGTTGIFNGVFMLGSMPQYTTFGAVIRCARSALNPLYASTPYPA